MIFNSLAHHQSWWSSFDPWYFTLSYFEYLLTFVKAVIIILKHATSLLLSGISWKSALTYADQHYQEANINLKIQEYLAAPSQKLTVEQLASFIMATDIGWFSILVSIVMAISHQVCTEYQVESLVEPHRLGDEFPVETQVPAVRRKDPWFKRVWEPLRNLKTRKHK